MHSAIAIQIQLTPDTRAEIILRVVQEPTLPTPNEPEISRAPLLPEWIDIVTRMKKLDGLNVKPAIWPGFSSDKLAHVIATDILTPHGCAECTRAQLMSKQLDGSERDMGGHNKQSLITVIKRHLP